MIKAEDLRIGDLVKIKENCSLKEGVISYITEIRTRGIFEKEDCVKLKHFDSDWEFGVWCCNIDPIPLTPEILEKNGWKKKREGWYIKTIDKYDYLSAEFGYEDGIRVFLKRAVNGLYAKLNTANNVHELQHILWALGESANLTI